MVLQRVAVIDLGGRNNFNTSNVMVLLHLKKSQKIITTHFNTSNVMVLQKVGEMMIERGGNFNTSNVMVLLFT